MGKVRHEKTRIAMRSVKHACGVAMRVFLLVRRRHACLSTLLLDSDEFVGVWIPDSDEFVGVWIPLLDSSGFLDSNEFVGVWIPGFPIIDIGPITIIDVSVMDQVPVASSLLRLGLWSYALLAVGAMTSGAATSADSKGCRGRGDGTDRSRLDAGAASSRRPKVQAGCRDCGSDGRSNDRSPRSARMCNAAPAWTGAMDSFHTIARPTDSRAGTRAGSELAPS